MPRRKRARKMVQPPGFLGFKPYGHSRGHKESVDLLYEEYEAIKLADYDNMSHEEACGLMGISRATFARIYEKARKKIAKALVEVSEIKTQYGNVCFDKQWYICNDCNSRFACPENKGYESCPLCESKNIEQIKI
jgi:predicted DNA-binding protein (UPF0251 family)